ncbi:hypothetical protein MSAN_00532200 [Mycena sanguinolenta]|uniref:Uncharacterized protein n=1 Tax=Mycena sanguinolenta TaxID=230812 RepID=A0A8H6Z9Q0_9AGAR|nr:hypothetical protein MSAN_00532200 [Mycena sanguinolenta]
MRSHRRRSLTVVPGTMSWASNIQLPQRRFHFSIFSPFSFFLFFLTSGRPSAAMLTDTPSISPPAAISLCFVGVLYGMHLLVFPCAVYVLCRKRLTRGILAMLAAVVFMFMMSTVLTVTLWTATILDGTIVGIYFNRGVRARILMWPRNMNLIAADAIVVWRMTVLYPNKVVHFGIYFLLFSFSALAIFNSIGEPADGPFERALILSTVASFLSFGTNFIATAALSWKAWIYRRRSPEAWRGSESLIAVNSAFMILIETGVLYLSWQLLVATITYVSSYCNGSNQSCIAVQFASNAMAESTTIVAALYPTTTLVIVALKKSIADQCGPRPASATSSTVSLTRSTHSKVTVIKEPQDAWVASSQNDDSEYVVV